MTDEEMQAEILRLTADKDVQLARTEQRMKYRQRQYLYTLRCLKKRGEELRKSGMTKERLCEMTMCYEGMENDE